MILDKIYYFDNIKFKESTGQMLEISQMTNTTIKYSYSNANGEKSVISIFIGLVNIKDIGFNFSDTSVSFISCGRIVFKNKEEIFNFVKPSWLSNFKQNN